MNGLPMLPSSIDLSWAPYDRMSYWREVLGEATYALSRVDRDVLRGLAGRTVALSVETASRRWGQLRELVAAVARGAWAEFKRAFAALVRGELGAYLKEVCVRLWEGMKRLWASLVEQGRAVARLVAAIPSMSRDELIEHLVALLAGVAGFAVIGGAGDGGLIDADIAALGLGGHRSIFFHSALMGFAFEVAVRATHEVVGTFHGLLPRDHSPFWDRLHKLGGIATASAVTGGWVGVASHLVIDSHFDGWTPYKDLPVVLPGWGHHLVMDMSAAASGFFAWHWRDKVVRLFSSPGRELPAVVGGDAVVVLR